jgi:hypothetical protein
MLQIEKAQPGNLCLSDKQRTKQTSVPLAPKNKLTDLTTGQIAATRKNPTPWEQLHSPVDIAIESVKASSKKR